jgi:hypothetical protein
MCDLKLRRTIDGADACCFIARVRHLPVSFCSSCFIFRVRSHRSEYVCRDLGNRFGKDMTYVWAIGLLAAGQSSTMTGTYTGQKTMEGFMDIRLVSWQRALLTRSVAMVPTVAVAVAYAGTSRMDRLNQFLNVLQSIQLPFALLPVLYISARTDVMGESFAVKAAFRAIVQTVSFALLGLNLLLVVQQVSGGVLTTAPIWVVALLVVTTVLYSLFVLYLFVGPAFVWRVFHGRSNLAARVICSLFGRPRYSSEFPGQEVSSPTHSNSNHMNVSAPEQDLLLHDHTYSEKQSDLEDAVRI